MAKQGVDKKTKEMPLMEKWEELEKSKALVASFDELFQGLHARYSEVKRHMLELKEAGINYAGTTYRSGKYLYLVYPSENGESRKREYIGQDPVKIKVELDKLERGRLYDKAEKQISEMERLMYWIKDDLQSALRHFR